MTTGLIAIHGRCSPAITLLRGTFVSSYAEDGAGGARIALIIGDETATDLWVGSSNPAHACPDARHNRCHLGLDQGNPRHPLGRGCRSRTSVGREKRVRVLE